MSALTNINRCSQETFNSIIAGTHATETYDPNAIYEVELDDPVELGAEGSGLTINIDNQLMCDIPPCTQTTAGNYRLRATVASGGTVTYSWVAE